MIICITWTDDRTEELKKLREEGYSASQIAHRMGNGITRNSVIGKISRLGLPPPPNKKMPGIRAPRNPKRKQQHKAIFRIIPANGNSKAMRVVKSVQTEFPFLRCVEAEPRNIPLSQLEENDCRYIAGNDLLYCARPKMSGSSFCPKHHALCYTAAPPSRPKACRTAA